MELTINISKLNLLNKYEISIKVFIKRIVIFLRKSLLCKIKNRVR